MRKTILSGVQPTGNLHLGNYLGALQKWVKLQDSYECIYCVVDLHAITVWQDPAELKTATREVAAGYLRILATRYLSGIKHPKKLEYAMISSYNGGAGNLWRSLDKNGNKTKSLARINNMTVSEFYWFLTNRHIRGETRNYLKKVSGKQKKYLHL